MIRSLALVTLLAGFALGALSALAEAPTLLPWSFGAAGAAIVLMLADAVASRRATREPHGERGAFEPDPAVWESGAETMATPPSSDLRPPAPGRSSPTAR